MKKRDRSKDYINNKTFYNDIKDWYASGSKDIPLPLCKAIMQICDRLGMKGNFRGYSYLDEMKGDALEYCLRALQEKKFNPEKYDNPFAYFSMIAYNQFVKIIIKEKKESYIKHKALENHYLDVILTSPGGRDVSQMLTDDAQINKDLIDKFEKKKDVPNEQSIPSATDSSGSDPASELATRETD